MADVQIFREHLEKHNLVGFGGYKIKTYLVMQGWPSSIFANREKGK